MIESGHLSRNAPDDEDKVVKQLEGKVVDPNPDKAIDGITRRSSMCISEVMGVCNVHSSIGTFTEIGNFPLLHNSG